VRTGDIAAAQNAVRLHTSRDFYRLVAARLDTLYPIEVRE